MPRIFSKNDFISENEIKQDYLDRHTPIIICQKSAKRGEILKVKVRVGSEYAHPDEGEHHIANIQLWNRETLLAEARYYPGTMGNKLGNIEVEFTVVMPQVSMNLTALSYCTKHGLWQSEPFLVKVISTD